MRRQRTTSRQQSPGAGSTGRRRLATGGAALMLLAGLATPAAGAIAAPAATGPASPSTPRTITWAPCEEVPAIQCGKLTLPVDWRKPGGATFELALAKRPADEPAASKGPLFINPGGPGGSGVNMTFTAGTLFSPEIRRTFDIIGIDPRGVARSHPVVCSAEAFARPGETVLPRTKAEYTALVRFNRQLAADCRQHTGPLYDHVDSVSVARDVDAVRAAIGADKLSWYGASYGTLMGQMYAELFPHRIRSMVNDGNMDHSLGTWRFLLSESSFAEDSFQQFVTWCGKSANCALHGQDVPKVYAELLAKADAGTLVDPADGTKLSTWDLLDITQFFFSRPRWVQLGELLSSLHTGTPSAAVRTARADLAATLQAVVPAAERSAAAVELVEDVRPQFCQDWSLPVRGFQELNALYGASLKVAPNMRTSVLALQSMTQCIGWPGKVNNPQHKLDVKGAPTILMMNGLHDPATGYSWAVNARRQLGNAVLVTYEGSGHVTYSRTACTRAAVDNYFLDLTVPAAGTRCAANDPALAPSARTQESPELTSRW
ncbi:alpha/beta hydrolase [Kribbella sp. CA-293567]|uniref:alpha/beta hydrolase n=1 Tax=Kribbella sp. CA-293567 TaxID=3002436 RepID=UPI0022DDE0EB|nr:alpha/beta hydrolase [Kribbella sp. CA-293567]WBQ06093.1 alpha/beta hydrolase [Kribbella sp. CA-293567]